LGALVTRWTQAENALPQTIIKSPQDLSEAFRTVSNAALPAIVAIETRTKAKIIQDQVADEDESDSDPLEGSPFADDPLFREFFGRGGRGSGNFRRQFRVPPSQGAGSGFVIDGSGVIVTNAHVVAGADEVTVKFSDGLELKAEKWMGDSVTDVAVVLVKPDKPLPSVRFGDSDKMQVGDWVLALGNPFDLGTTVTAGIISATDRKGLDINAREHFLQTDAAINPGNSGGALVNMNAEVIGINTAISTRSGGYDGVGFAIPANQAFMGVQLQGLTAQVKKALGVNSGVAVEQVIPGTPAAKAGMMPGDIIVNFNGQPAKDRPSLQEYVETLEPGKTYVADILRDGESVKLDVTLEARGSDAYSSITPRKDNSEKSEKPVAKLGRRERGRHRSGSPEHSCGSGRLTAGGFDRSRWQNPGHLAGRPAKGRRRGKQPGRNPAADPQEQYLKLRVDPGRVVQNRRS
jgi:serine protease Do